MEGKQSRAQIALLPARKLQFRHELLLSPPIPERAGVQERRLGVSSPKVGVSLVEWTAVGREGATEFHGQRGSAGIARSGERTGRGV